MSSAQIQVDRFAILCVGIGGGAVAPALRAMLEGRVQVLSVASCAEVADRMDALASERVAVAVVIAEARHLRDETWAESLRQRGVFGPPRLLAVEDASVRPPAGPDGSSAEAVLTGHADPAEAARLAREFLTDFIVEHQPASLPGMCDALDNRVLAAALAEAQRESAEIDGRLRMLRRSITSASRLSDTAAEAQMIRLLRETMPEQQEQHLPAGTVMFHEDTAVQGIWVVLDGVVELTRRGSGGEDIVFHSKSVGRIVGLMALVGHQKTFFTARAKTAVTALYLTWNELDDALQREPGLLLYFLTVHTRSLGNRLRRIVELQLQIEDLNRALATERDQLADALGKLEAAQTRLIEQEKMATLGQLVAGVGHELNNPATAITRSADYVIEDATWLLRQLPEGDLLHERLVAGMTSTPLPTETLRRRRDALAAALGDDALARRLMRMGITTIEAYREAFGNDRPEVRDQRLGSQERAYQLGVSLRNIRSSGERISAIVKSLRSYARVEEQASEVDVHEGLEETLLLFQVRLQSIKVRREYGEVPPVRGWAAELNQVWTNLISNALDAMGEKGELTLQTLAPAGSGQVVVRIIDNGPGIAPEHLPRVFDLNFTTKRAGAGFGLGMGLMICRQIVARHGGRIELESRPGRTCVQVTLPIQPVEKET